MKTLYILKQNLMNGTVTMRTMVSAFTDKEVAVVEFTIVRKVKVGNVITKCTHIAEKKWENVKSVKYLRDWELRPMYKALSKYVEEVPNTNITCVETLRNNTITVNKQ